MPLAPFDAPFEHPGWIFEPKMDGFRAVAYVEGGACRLVSRNRNAFKRYETIRWKVGHFCPAAVPTGPAFKVVDAAERPVGHYIRAGSLFQENCGGKLGLQGCSFLSRVSHASISLPHSLQ
jgi:hypothetical protein